MNVEITHWLNILC